MSSEKSNHSESVVRNRVGLPSETKTVDVKLNDCAYELSLAKYRGRDAHLGAICVSNGWVDKVEIHVDEKTGKRTFTLPALSVGKKLHLPEAAKLKELDSQAFATWNEKFPPGQHANGKSHEAEKPRKPLPSEKVPPV